ncbi:MAG: HAD-IA family hydrolase [Pseudomonadota bacterium]
MSVQAVIFGSIGTLAETSDLQRRAYNLAFVAEGLDWYWDAHTYAGLLTSSGGTERIAEFGELFGEDVDAAKIHDVKVAQFKRLLNDEVLAPRDGVTQLIAAAKSNGVDLAFATTTSADQMGAVLDAMNGAVRPDDFAFVGDRSQVTAEKPDPEIYSTALSTLGVRPDEAIAIEDSPTGAQAALAAGVTTFVTPGAMHLTHQFPAGAIMLTRASADLLQQSQIAAQ